MSQDFHSFIGHTAATRPPAPGLRIGPADAGSRGTTELPFVVGVLADLGGRSAAPLPGLAERRFVEVDVDNFDDVLKATKARLCFEVVNTLSGEGTLPIDLGFESLDDFSPAAIVRQVAPLQRLMAIRTEVSKLGSSSGKDGPAKRLAEILQDPAVQKTMATAVAPASHPGAGVPQDADPFAGLLGKGVAPLNPVLRKPVVAQSVASLCAAALGQSSLVSSESLRTIAALVTELDRRLSGLVNLILHHDAFRALEGTWRGLRHLVFNTETDEMLKIAVLNVTKAELHSSLVPEVEGAEPGPLHVKICVEPFLKGRPHPFGVLIGDYAFDHSDGDLPLLTALARIALAAHAPFFAAAPPSLLGLESWSQVNEARDLARISDAPAYAAWKLFRKSEEARYVGLTVPRFLSRIPYGADKNPVDEFDFEEDTANGNPRNYVWSNAAYALATRVTRAFKEFGWTASIRGHESGGLVEGLSVDPFPTDDHGGVLERTTEVTLTDRIETGLLECGLIPLCHSEGSSVAVFQGVRSLHEPLRGDSDEATVNARLASSFPYLLPCCRFAHHLMVLVRMNAGRFSRKEEWEGFLNPWLQQYVGSSRASEESKARFPLASGQVVVVETPELNGMWILYVHLRPHYQLDGLTSPIRLIIRIRS